METQTVRVEMKHPLAIRWFHWIHFPVLAVMIWSGALIYWANPIYHLGPILLYNDPFFKALGLERRLAEGMAWHFMFAWFFALNGILYAIFLAASGQWRALFPGKGTLRDAWQTVLHDLHLRPGATARGKFNGAQQIAYTGILVMGLGSVLTGLAIYKPVQLSWLTALFGGYPASRFIHFWLTVGFCLFFLIHVAQVVRAGWNNFRAMVTGYEVVPREGPREQA